MEQKPLRPCPFCGSHNLRVDMIFFDDDGEHEGVECLDCDASNRIENWNTRADELPHYPDFVLEALAPIASAFDAEYQRRLHAKQVIA